MRLVLLTEGEAAFIEQAAELWLAVHEGDWGEEVGRLRSDRVDVLRKLNQKYTRAEHEQMAAILVEMME